VRPILEALNATERLRFILIALAILALVIVVRLVWVMAYALLPQKSSSSAPNALGRAKNGILIGWSGMRGIVTLAAAMALPPGFPYRDFIQLTAFAVVVGTLLIQGLTLRPLLAFRLHCAGAEPDSRRDS
jgi:NhaP-type Na+/H+ or K+/H+ antiporter